MKALAFVSVKYNIVNQILHLIKALAIASAFQLNAYLLKHLIQLFVVVNALQQYNVYQHKYSIQRLAYVKLRID